MPSYLHPRSAATSTLFAGTLLASFIVVGIPHVFPCPRPRKGYADSEIIFDAEGRPIRRIRRKSDTTADSESKTNSSSSSEPILLEVTSQTALDTKLAKTLEQEAALFKQLQDEAAMLDKERRECPVPKPTGVIGRLFGFSKDEQEQETKIPTSSHVNAGTAAREKE